MKRPYKVDIVANTAWSRLVLSGLIGTSLVGLSAVTSGCKTGGQTRSQQSTPMPQGSTGMFPQSSYDAPQMAERPMFETSKEPQYLEPLPPPSDLSGGHSEPWSKKKSSPSDSFPPKPAMPPLPPAPSFETSVPQDAEIDVKNDLIAQRRSVSLDKALSPRPLVSLGQIEPFNDSAMNIADSQESVPTWSTVPPLGLQHPTTKTSSPKLLTISASETKPINP